MRYVKIIAVSILFCVTFLVSSLALARPMLDQGIMTISGSILRCDIEELGTWGVKIFVGMELDVPKTTYFRFNIPQTKRAHYETLCAEHTDVTIRYRPKRHEHRPEISYWAEDIKKNKDKETQEIHSK